ncbi:Oleosin 16 kDa [Apostasia shenzhenica]|uniref:Oleosin n=1 Tax=Apostasia shenzhenica TaxID=1088818 RepID=A0A2I0ACQ2_9ASPA|nr:Oleosin 16 kDa [Apostasia shenzhenica]
MADQRRGDWGQQPQPSRPPSMSQQIVKAAAAAAAGGSMLLLSGLTLAGTVIALTVATPLLVIFSPVLVPAAFALTLLAGGFLTSGGFGVAALSVLSWMYKYMTGKHPVGADQIDQARARIAEKARDIKSSAQQRAEQASL